MSSRVILVPLALRWFMRLAVCVAGELEADLSPVVTGDVAVFLNL
jgi:hypothetical protein